MRVAIFLVPILAASTIVLAGCGYIGDPKAPALRRPTRVTDLAAAERGSKIVVTFTLPEETTEGMPISTPPDVELRVGAVPNPWNQDAWQASSDRVPVPAWQPLPRGASGGGARKVMKGGIKSPLAAKGASGAKKKSAKPTKAVAAAAARVFYSRSIEIDAAKYVNKTAAVGLRVHGPNGRDDGWSIVSLQVLPVLPVPRSVQATDGPNAVHLQWSADAPGFRIFRKLPDATEWTQVGESAQASFDDKTFDYGKTWQYYVESVRKAGDNWLESEPSETITFTPVDRFPPAVPTGLVVISGTLTIELSWDRGTDSDLAGYRVYRDGVKIADAVMTPAYSDKDVKAGSKYSYAVSAVDQAGNESAKCAAQEITME